MAATTSTEFKDWIEFLDKYEWKRTTATHYYLAQIAMEIRRGNVKEPDDLKLESFLLKFELEEAANKKVELPPTAQEALEERVARSKAVWFGITGAVPPPQ